MSNRSLARIKRTLAHQEYIDVLQTLSREKVELADFLDLETQLDFDQAMSLIEMLCTEILPGYQGIGKLVVFRNEIRDRLKSSIIDFEDWCDHRETINDARNPGCP